MPESTITDNDELLDEFDLHELRAMRPERLELLAPDWELQRDALGASLAQRPTPLRRRPVLQLAVAAAVVAVVGGIGLALPRDETIPAAPTPTQGTRQGAMIDPRAEIPAGRRIIEKETIRRSDASTSVILTSFEADGRVLSWMDGTPQQTQRVDQFQLSGMVPSDPAALADWLMAGRGSSAVPATPNATTPAIPREDRLWSSALVWLRNPTASPELRKALVEVARTAGGGISVTSTTRQGRDVLVVTRAVSRDGFSDRGQIVLDPKTLRAVEATRERSWVEGDAASGRTRQSLTQTTTWELTTAQPRP